MPQVAYQGIWTANAHNDLPSPFFSYARICIIYIPGKAQYKCIKSFVEEGDRFSTRDLLAWRYFVTRGTVSPVVGDITDEQFTSGRIMGETYSPLIPVENNDEIPQYKV